MTSSNAHVVLSHFGCVPTYFGSSAVKTSVLAAVHCHASEIPNLAVVR